MWFSLVIYKNDVPEFIPPFVPLLCLYLWKTEGSGKFVTGIIIENIYGSVKLIKSISP